MPGQGFEELVDFAFGVVDVGAGAEAAPRLLQGLTRTELVPRITRAAPTTDGVAVFTGPCGPVGANPCPPHPDDGFDGLRLSELS